MLDVAAGAWKRRPEAAQSSDGPGGPRHGCVPELVLCFWGRRCGWVCDKPFGHYAP